MTNKHSVLYMMRDFIKTFFSCKGCVNHFIEISSQNEKTKLENHLKNSNSSVMWLWDIHNRVNERIGKEEISVGDPG